MRVLLIEDDSATAQSIELMLQSEGFNVYTTDLGEEGVDLGKLYDYDIVLLDLNLPDMHGFDVLKKLRQAKITTPALILSGSSETEAKVRGYLPGRFSFSVAGGRCEACSGDGTIKIGVMNDQSGLYAERLRMKSPDDHIVLPEIISKEPLGPWVRKGDEQWFTLVRWTLFAMLNAEELGVTSANVDEMLKSTNPEIKRLLGTEGAQGEQLGVTKDWVVRIMKHVGNYGESFEKHLGPKTRVGLDRGPNRLWTQGGLQYAPPIR